MADIVVLSYIGARTNVLWRSSDESPGQWQVAGSAPEVYERDLVPAVFGAWAPILIGLAPPKPGDRVIDIACGTGIVSRIAAAKVGPSGAVAGVDLNPGMLNVARSLKTTD